MSGDPQDPSVHEDGSVQGAISAIFARHEQEQTLEVPVWWSDELPEGIEVIVRFRMVGRRRLNAIVASTVTGPKPDTSLADLLIVAEACDEILLSEAGQRGSLDPTGQPVRFGPRLGEICGWSAATAAEAVERFYRLEIAPLALSGVTRPLLDWLSGTREQVGREALGESATAS